MKKALSILLSLCLALSLFACSQPSSGASASAAGTPAADGSGPSQAAADEEKITTTFWTDFLVDEALFTTAIEDFCAEHPNYTINFEKFGGSDRDEKIALAKQSDTLPSLLFVASFTCMDEVHQGTVIPLTEQVDAIRDDIFPSTLEPSTINGENYMYPLFQSYFGMLYNADMFREAGLERFVDADPYAITVWTLDEFENEILPALKQLTQGTEKYPMALFAGNNQADTYTNSWLRMFGGTVFADGKAVAGATPETVQALEKLNEWYQAGYTNSDVVTKLSTECMGDFKNQNVAVCFGQYTNYASIHADFENNAYDTFDFRVAVIPKQEGGKDSASIASYIYGAMLMNVDEKQQKVAREFLDWLSKNETGALQAFNTAGVPVLRSMSEAASSETPIFASYNGVDQYVYDFTGAVPGYVQTRALQFPALQSVFSGEKTAQQALDEFDAGANKVIEEYIARSVVLNG